MTSQTITQQAHQFTDPTVRPIWTGTAPPVADGRLVGGAARAAERLSDAWPRLQARLVAAESAARVGGERSMVIVPSRTIDKWHEPVAETQAYEERLLCSLLGLRDPKLRITYVTSSPIVPAIVEQYLSLLPRRIRRDARSRLSLIAAGESGSRPLSQKLLERPDVLAAIRRTVHDSRVAHLVPYNTTPLERDVALALDIPMYGADPGHALFGTKSGCRKLFAEASVPHPTGLEGIRSVQAAIDGIIALRRVEPGLSRLVMKLNEGVSGDGNAIIDLAGLPAPGAADEARSVAERVAGLAPEAAGVTADAYLSKLAQRGGIIEAWIAATELRSPSVQLEITPYGEVRVVSTHDQILGGPSGQSYLGCRFPAPPSYAPAISRLALRVGERLAAAGVIGRCAIDFVVAQYGSGGWRPFAIELNLRKGGTTHPFETLAHLTGGTYDPQSATFRTPLGQEKHYVATDHLEAPQLRELGLDGVLRIARQPGLRFDRMQRTGVVFHMLSCAGELGRVGFTAIADTAAEADALYARVQERALAEPRPLAAVAA